MLWTLIWVSESASLWKRKDSIRQYRQVPTHTHTSTDMCHHTHRDMCLYIYTYIHTSTGTYIYKYRHTHVHIGTNMDHHTYTYKHWHGLTNTWAWVCIHTSTDTRTHTPVNHHSSFHRQGFVSFMRGTRIPVHVIVCDVLPAVVSCFHLTDGEADLTG